MIAVRKRASANRKPRTVVQDLQELGGMAREMAQEKVEQVRASAVSHANEGREQVRLVGHKIESYIREQPVRCMLIAAGVGLLFGRFWMRR